MLIEDDSLFKCYLTRISEDGDIIFTEQILGNQAIIELEERNLIVGGKNAFLDGGYGEAASIVKLSF